MRPGVGAAIVGALGVAQVGAAATVAGLIAKYLDGEFHLDDTGLHAVSCALSMKSASACTAGYVSVTASCLLSLLLIAMQCGTVEGRVGLGFCGPIVSAVGFFWWLAYAATATSAANGAQRWDELTEYRTAVVGMAWGCAFLFLLSFCISSAAAAAASRARIKLAAPQGSLARSNSSKRFNQPAASPPSSPCKSNKSFSSAYEPFDSDSPKKWVQPPNPSRAHLPVTSDGLRTLLLVEGEPVPLSPGVSPSGSPMAARSPGRGGGGASLQLQRSLMGSGGSGSVGSFSNVLLGQGSQAL